VLCILFVLSQQTNGDNEPWTLVNTTENYDAIIAAITFRDQLRNYVMDTQVMPFALCSPNSSGFIALGQQAAWATTNAPIDKPDLAPLPGRPCMRLHIHRR